MQLVSQKYKALLIFEQPTKMTQEEFASHVSRLIEKYGSADEEDRALCIFDGEEAQIP